MVLVEQQDVDGKDDDVEDFEEVLLECALEAGAINVEELSVDDEEDDSGDGGSSDAHHTAEGKRKKAYIVTTEERDLWQVVTALQEHGYNVSQFEHRYVLQDDEHGSIDLSKFDEAKQQLEDILEKLDDDEDVNNVYHNATQ
jgi:transcriptional/translational regulatory protein YebC/TACO1